MTFYQKAFICSSDAAGKGKAVYFENDNGKVTKKTKNFDSGMDFNNLYNDFGFADPLISSENFWNRSFSFPFKFLGDLAEDFFGDRYQQQKSLESNLLPEGVDLAKYQVRLKELQDKKKREEQEKEQKESQKKFLEEKVNELKNIKKELKEAGETEDLKEIDEDIKKIEERLKEF